MRLMHIQYIELQFQHVIFEVAVLFLTKNRLKPKKNLFLVKFS